MSNQPGRWPSIAMGIASLAPESYNYRSPGNGDSASLYDNVYDPTSLFSDASEGVPGRPTMMVPGPVDVHCHPIESQPAHYQPGPNLPMIDEYCLRALSQQPNKFWARMLSPTTKHY
jgi:hypothetical protein